MPRGPEVAHIKVMWLTTNQEAGHQIAKETAPALCYPSPNKRTATTNFFFKKKEIFSWEFTIFIFKNDTHAYILDIY